MCHLTSSYLGCSRDPANISKLPVSEARQLHPQSMVGNYFHSSRATPVADSLTTGESLATGFAAIPAW
jgi:hypothetical protein